MSGLFIPLPEPMRTWLLDRMWSDISVSEVVRNEPTWRIWAQVPRSGWAFNYSQVVDPGLRSPP